MDIYIKKLADVYISETTDSCGQKFCGCTKDDCNNYDKKHFCRICLLKYVKEQIDKDLEMWERRGTNYE